MLPGDGVRWICSFAYCLMILKPNKNKQTNTSKAPIDLRVYSGLMEAQSNNRGSWRACLTVPPRHQPSFSPPPVVCASIPVPSEVFLLSTPFLSISLFVPLFKDPFCPSSPEHLLPGTLFASRRRSHSGSVSTSLLARAICHYVTSDTRIYRPLLLPGGHRDNAGAPWS